MNDDERIKLGSQTAKSGFKNEDIIIKIFEYWKKNNLAKTLLKEMFIDIFNIQELKVEKAPSGQKTDIILKIKNFDGSEYDYKISIKKYGYTLKEDGSKKKFNYNQIDKRTIDKAKKFWNIPNDIVDELRKFTGEKGFSAKELLNKKEITKEKYDSLKDKRRIFLNELNKKIQQKIIDFFKKNKSKIIKDLIKGNGEFAADWLLVDEVELNSDKTLKRINKITVKSMDEAIKIFSDGSVKLTKNGNLKIGKITLQRKGGTPDPTKLQFKISPGDIFEDVSKK